MNANVIVWDLDAVPDLRGFAAANGLAGKTDEEVREAIGNKFPGASGSPALTAVGFVEQVQRR
jgi:hypothetical protein